MDIGEQLDRYGETQGVLPERLEEVGDTYREQGFLTREQLYDVAYHASTRSAHHVRGNDEGTCREVTANALLLEDMAMRSDYENDFSMVALLSGLKGFKAPIASCVTTALNPERHAVVDTRVWASLERLDRVEGRKETFGPRDYCVMMRGIREMAKESGYTAAEVGYALFAWDVEVRDGNLH